MLKTKRTFDMMMDMDTSPNQCTPFTCASPSAPPAKKKRLHAVDPSSPSRGTQRCDSKFANPPPFKGVLLEKYVDKTIQKNKTKRNKELLFSIDDLKEVIERAITEREEELRIEYDSLLAQRQQEQFQQFARFTEDYISKKKVVPESSFTYMY